MNEVLIQAKKQKKFHIIKSIFDLKKLIGDLPSETECYKFFSFSRLASISFIMFVAETEVIEHLYVSTLRVGKRQLMMLDYLKREGKLLAATLLTGGIMERDNAVGKKYGYYDNLLSVCEANGWRRETVNNHSKLVLMKTAEGNYYVLETSSNLNENPNMEQFSFENDRELFEFYKKVFDEIIGED
jgi:hypothetical protein